MVAVTARMVVLKESAIVHVCVYAVVPADRLDKVDRHCVQAANCVGLAIFSWVLPIFSQILGNYSRRTSRASSCQGRDCHRNKVHLGSSHRSYYKATQRHKRLNIDGGSYISLYAYQEAVVPKTKKSISSASISVFPDRQKLQRRQQQQSVKYIRTLNINTLTLHNSHCT